MDIVKGSVKMKTVVITGSARGLGLEMAKNFKQNNINVVISDLNEEKLENAKKELEKIKSDSKVSCCICNVTKKNDIENLIRFTKKNSKPLIFGLTMLE